MSKTIGLDELRSEETRRKVEAGKDVAETEKGWLRHKLSPRDLPKVKILGSGWPLANRNGTGGNAFAVEFNNLQSQRAAKTPLEFDSSLTMSLNSNSGQ